MLNSEFIIDKINQRFPDVILKSSSPYEMLTLEVKKDQIIPILKFLKEDESLGFQFLTDLCGIHYPDQGSKELGVVYHMHNLVKNVRIRIKTFFSVDRPFIPSATSLFAAANWMERETFDFYGIQFEGHPDLRRILNVDEMNYSPMRKEFPLEDGTRTDKDDRFFGRDGHVGREFDKRADRI